MKKLLIPLITTPLIYLLIAISLIFIPVTRNQPEKSLDFDVLDFNTISDYHPAEKSFTARDNNKLFYRYFQGSTDLTIILIHGSGSEGRYLLPLAAKLNSALGLDVAVPDL